MKCERRKSSRLADKNWSAQVLDAIDANIAVLDSEGVILATNKGWRDFAESNPLPDGSLPRQVEVGANYLGACKKASGTSSVDAMRVCEGIRAVLTGKNRSFAHEYPCHSPKKQRWFLMRVKAILRTKPREVVVTHFDITDRRLAEIKFLDKQHEVDAALLKLQELAGQIKASMGGRPGVGFVGLPKGRKRAPELLKLLSRRESEVLSGLVRGERNSAIAARLNLSRKSITTYRSRIFEKLQVENSIQLAALMTGVDSDE